MTGFRDDMTVREARELLRAHAQADGHTCPVCTQFTKVYKRKLTGSMVNTLGKVWRAQQSAENGWVYLPEIPQHSRDFSTVAFFGLAEAMPGRKGTGVKQGWWRVTNQGYAFLRAAQLVRKYAVIFDGRCLRFEGDPVSIKDIAPEFNYYELMAGV